MIKEIPLVKKIMALLKLDDDGILYKFFNKLIKEIETKIKKLETNLKALKLNYEEVKLPEVDEKIEDAEQAVDAAYQNVKIEDIKNNAEIGNFSTIYWDRITQAELKLKNLKEEREKLVISYEKEEKDINNQILKYKERIEKILNK